MSIGPNGISLTDLTFLAFNLNAAIDSRRYDTLPIEDVRRAVQDGTIFAYLKTKLGHDIDLSILDADSAAKAELLAEWQDMESVIDARRKFRVKHRALPLLFAFLLESIQRRMRKAA